MSRKSREHAQEAAERASEAARILQARGQEARTAVQQDAAAPSDSHVDPATGEENAGVHRPEPRNDPRRLAMQEIEERHERTQAENPYANTPEQAQDAPPPEPPAAPEPAETTPQAVTTDQPPVEDAAAPIKTVRVKVDGEEFDAPEADVQAAGGINAYQRDRASENRLRKANEALAETRRVQEQIAQWAAQQIKAQPVAEPPTVAKLLQDSIETIRWGSSEESAAALQKVIEASNPRLDPRVISDYAVQEMQKQTALVGFKAEFADVVANPLVLKLAITLEQERLAEMRKAGQRPADWPMFYRTIGNEVRSVMGRPSQPAQAAPVTTDSTSQPPVDKEGRKASIVNLPTAAARAALPEAPKPETREDILNQLRKTRGIPTG